MTEGSPTFRQPPLRENCSWKLLLTAAWGPLETIPLRSGMGAGHGIRSFQIGYQIPFGNSTYMLLKMVIEIVDIP